MDETTSRVIRKAQRDDHSSIALIHQDARIHSYSNILTHELLHQSSFDDRERYWLNNIVTAEANDSSIYVAEDQSAIRGFLVLKYDRRRNVGIIDRVYVSPNWLRRAVGSSLIQESLAELQKLSYSKALLWVFEQNISARKFYEAMGFTADGAERKLSGYPKEVRYAKGVGGF